jgi:hypothetical protein
MQRLRGIDIRLSDFPQTIGLCQSDTVGVFQALNAVQQRLLYCKEAGEESWWGTWAEIAFTMSRTTPYVTLERDIARLELVDICDRPVEVNNQFREYLRFGNGRFPKIFRQGHCGCFSPQVYSRNNVPTWVDLPNPPQFIQAYPSNNADVGLRVLIQGADNNGTTVISQDGFNRVTGLWQPLQTPFTQWPTQFSTLTGIQKDVTTSPVNIFAMDPTSGVQTLLVTLQPQETTAWYRRYYFSSLPFNCCTFTGPNPCSPNQPASSVAVTAIAKLEFIPVTTDTDYCLIQNLQALIEEGQAHRYSKMDSIQSKQLEAIKHKDSVRLLSGEITHYLGLTEPAINLSVFGDAHLSRAGIGTML